MAHPDLANYCMVCGYPFEENDPDLAEERPTINMKCVKCKEVIPITNKKRPLKVKCPECGQIGIIRQKDKS